MSPDAPTVLTEREWRAREEAHVARMRTWTVPHQARRSRGEKHPVWDFLFTYYSLPPSQLERWQPGAGTVVTGPGARTFLARTGYVETAIPGAADDDADTAAVTVDPAALTAKRARMARHVLALLEATASRTARLSCFGLHEWAMVYRDAPDQVRHSQLPLRLGSAGTDEVVDRMDIRCTHYDAFRFFTEPARPLNTLQPTRNSQRDLEQPGCLHVGMDIYKWAYKLGPLTPSELLADCFELAADIRELDMRASPYDLSSLGYDPVRIETAAGRAEYARRQAAFTRRAAPLRERLITLYRGLLASAEVGPESH
ncbi:3-methyladenine DNA glycosylase [Saccharomonospora sp. CUA-673]|uniref:3-methyladenine DNA glycosylase n=1 Tax=Saccharomonospora sp. CUA-673 TaxID=1904969 RepID=UPI0009652A9B|nr:3-methyladenine DNA glycosylase [Saccharomonospora sp. CUA-673]OLT43130.1 3-methyladenine DNA glycosylase [Saccharomonospora sp. CUA-673]